MSGRKRTAILQSNYIPWKGYFDLINSVDEFVLFDTAQFTKNDWRNRNKIKTSKGVAWLTIPVRHQFGQSIQDTMISDPDWSRRHWATLTQNYSKAPYFDFGRSVFEALYAVIGNEPALSAVNYQFLTAICRTLGIQTRITWSRDYQLVDGQTERLVELCKQTGADEYISGPSARDYIRGELFTQAGIVVSYFGYSGYPVYRQQFPPFEHAVSILDLIFNEGPDASKYMKSFGMCGIDQTARSVSV